jgi:hypothetical protein
MPEQCPCLARRTRRRSSPRGSVRASRTSRQLSPAAHLSRRRQLAIRYTVPVRSNEDPQAQHQSTMPKGRECRGNSTARRIRPIGTANSPKEATNAQAAVRGSLRPPRNSVRRCHPASTRAPPATRSSAVRNRTLRSKSFLFSELRGATNWGRGYPGLRGGMELLSAFPSWRRAGIRKRLPGSPLASSKPTHPL